MRNTLFIVAGVLAVLAAAFYGGRWLLGGRAASPEELVREALEADELRQRESAAVELTRFGRPARPYLRDVLARSDAPEVRAACLQGLAELWDYESMPAMLDGLGDPSDIVRARAGAAVQRMLAVDYGYQHDAPDRNREAVAKALRDHWETWKDSALFKKWLKRLEGEFQIEEEASHATR